MRWTNGDAETGGSGAHALPRKSDDDGSASAVSDAIAELLGDRSLVVVSNRQPYSHEYEDGKIVASPPAGGLTAALDPVMQALSGTWIAWGSGEADRQVTDGSDTVALPPGEGVYDLRRVWLTEDEVDEYYRGYSNRVLWPLCHADVGKVDVRPGDWETYAEVNDTFADAVLEECGESDVVWFHDYHFGLAPSRVREGRPEAFLAQFWHVPWPAWDVFRACPHHEALLRGLLANDLLGCHTETDCRNFLDCAAGADIGRVDRTTGSVRYDGGRTYVRPFPIGVDAGSWADRAITDEADAFRRSLRADHDLAGEYLAVGVDRLDYTKGIEERLDALAHLWETRPDLRERLTYVQKASLSRQDIPAYSRLRDRVEERIDGINERFGTDDWEPIVYRTDHLSSEALAGLYRAADCCLVTPVRDGMNLVAKEFVATQGEDPGVLVLSELAGAVEQLEAGSVVVNPYDSEESAAAIAEALELPPDERRQRAATLQTAVRQEDVYAWLVAQFRTVARLLDQQQADELLT